MYPLLFSFFILLITLFSQLHFSHSLQQQRQQRALLLPNKCNERCGSFDIPYPFHLNKTCGSVSASFRLSCLNSTTLFLRIGSQNYRVLAFLSDGILVNFPGSSTCRQYNDFNAFGFVGNDYYGISVDNVVSLYDCEDSSLCKAGCETNVMPGCDGNGGGYPNCCYPLSDHSAWHVGEGFSTFSQFGCRGFSCWVVLPGTTSGKRGVKLEWAIPRNSFKGTCAKNANSVNATTVGSGIRCFCQDGFVGDGFTDGVGCQKSRVKDGQAANGNNCCTKRRGKGRAVMLAGVLASAFIIASMIAVFCLLKRPVKSGTFDPDQACFQSTVSFRKACRTRLFTYHELEEATKGFEVGQKLTDGTNSTVHAGVLGDGSHVAVHKLQCQNERDLIQVMSQVEILSTVLHRNMARLLGCCIDSGYTPLIVYEYPANGTLKEHLHQSRGPNTVLDWYKRLNIATETASVLAFLQYEISPPIFHHDLKSGCIFLDQDFSVKIAGFSLLSAIVGDRSQSCNKPEGSGFNRSDVYDLGVVLLEIIAGSNRLDTPTVALQKIRDGKLEEIVDPLLYYHEQPSYRHEQIEIVADLATRCLLFGGDGKLGMMDVARELLHITKESVDGSSRRGPALEETFSNSSLLQMISMSPDSIYVP